MSEEKDIDTMEESSVEEMEKKEVEVDVDEKAVEQSANATPDFVEDEEVPEEPVDEDKGGERKSYRRRNDMGRGDKKFFYTKKVCKFCTNQLDEKTINYKNVDMLRRFVMPSGKLVPRRINGCCAKHQRRISNEIKRARIMAFLPFVDR